MPEHNLVLMRGVTGTRVGGLLAADSTVQPLDAMRQAARWLARFHGATERIGDPEPEWDSLKIFRLTVRLIKASAASPGERDVLLDTMHMLKRRMQRLPCRPVLVQTHGRYHHDHVFLNGDVVSVIDFDRSRPADSAKDVAEFVRVLRTTAFRSGWDPQGIDRLSDAFLTEYLSLAPAAAESLPFYWASFILLGYFGLVRKPHATDARCQELLAFHVRELDRVLREVR